MTKSDRFKEISSIYSCLSRAEKDTLSAYIGSIQGRSHKDYEQTSELFKVLEANPEISKKEVLTQLKLNKESKLFINGFLLRSREVLLESMVLAGNLERPGEYSNKFRNQVFNRKKLLEASILLSRGERIEAEKLLLEVESRAEKYELPDQVVEAKQLLKVSFANHRSARVLKRYAKEIDHWISVDADLQRAKNLYSDIVFLISRYPESKNEIDKLLRKLTGIEKKTSLRSVALLRLSLEVQLLMADGDYKAALENLSEILDMRINVPPVQSDKGISDTKMKMGQCHAFLLNFDAAGIQFEEADALVKNDSFESYLLRKYLIMLDFYQSPTSRTEDELLKRISSTYTTRVPYAMASYYLLRAIFMIADNRANKAADLILNELRAIQGSPEEENFHRNAYLFIAGAELAASEPRRGKSICQRALKNIAEMDKKALSPRHQAINRSFQKILALDFDFKEFKSRNPTLVERLETGTGDTRWIPLTSEVMPVHSWINHKIDRRKKLFKA